MRILFFNKVYIGILRQLNFLLVLLNFRQDHHFWGVVYDSVSKQPLDPVVVTLVSAGLRMEVQTCITDLSGHYGFLATPGKYKILAKKENYLFPSKIIEGSEDTLYQEIYHGEFFEISEDSEVVAPNIPMDPVKTDWNQQAKQKYEKQFPYWKFLFKRLISVIFWFAMAWSLIMLAGSLGKKDLFVNPIPIGVLLFGVGAWVLNRFLPEVRLWGKVKFSSADQLGHVWYLETARPEMPTVILAKSKINRDGKFFLRAKPGNYLLTICKVLEKGKIEKLGSKKVCAHREGVVNVTLKV